MFSSDASVISVPLVVGLVLPLNYEGLSNYCKVKKRGLWGLELWQGYGRGRTPYQAYKAKFRPLQTLPVLTIGWTHKNIHEEVHFYLVGPKALS